MKSINVENNGNQEQDKCTSSVKNVENDQENGLLHQDIQAGNASFTTIYNFATKI